MTPSPLRTDLSSAARGPGGGGAGQGGPATVSPGRAGGEEALRGTSEGVAGSSLLTMAFESFNRATETLQRSYALLQKRVKELTLELHEKNRELERNLKEKEEVKNHLNNILESLQTGVVVLDLEGKVRLFNRAAQQLTRLRPEEVLGSRGEDKLSAYLPDRAAAVADPESAAGSQEWEIQVRDHLDPDPLRLLVSLAAMRDQRDSVVGTVVLLQNVTRIRRLEEEGQRRSRLLAMGEMAAHLAHEIRNPLGSIELFATLLQRELTSEPDKRELAERISSGVRGLDHIITNLLLFTKSQRPATDSIRVNQLVEETLNFSGYLLEGNRVVPEIALAEIDPGVRGDRELLKQVFLNLIMNSVQAMPDGGTLAVCTRLLPSSGREGAAGRNDQVEITFRDSGVGIAESHLQRIFDPFFTTRESGTGLGLAIVHNIVAAHGGRVRVHSRTGEGTKLTLCLPAEHRAG